MIRKISTIIFALSLMAALPTLGMEWLEQYQKSQQNPVYPCDNCHEEKELLNYAETKRNGISCLHILCHECQNAIDEFWKKPVKDKVWWPCDSCSYFCNQHNKQCWQTTEDIESILILSASGQWATRFKMEYPDRMLPDITDTTLFRPNPEQTIQWYHIASIPIAAIACCITYIVLNKLD